MKDCIGNVRVWMKHAEVAMKNALTTLALAQEESLRDIKPRSMIVLNLSKLDRPHFAGCPCLYAWKIRRAGVDDLADILKDGPTAEVGEVIEPLNIVGLTKRNKL